MPDHYHCVARAGRGKELPEMVKRIRGSLGLLAGGVMGELPGDAKPVLMDDLLGLTKGD